jgi:hypothetical protein
MAWTEEQKKQAIELYQAGNPTAENSTELVKEIAETMEQSPNGVRQVLVQASVYVKKEVGGTTTTAKTGTKTTTKDGAEPTKRVSKESQIDALRKAIENAGAAVDEEIITKLTGKAAAYFTTVFAAK